MGGVYGIFDIMLPKIGKCVNPDTRVSISLNSVKSLGVGMCARQSKGFGLIKNVGETRLIR